MVSLSSSPGRCGQWRGDRTACQSEAVSGNKVRPLGVITWGAGTPGTPGTPGPRVSAARYAAQGQGPRVHMMYRSVSARGHRGCRDTQHAATPCLQQHGEMTRQETEGRGD